MEYGTNDNPGFVNSTIFYIPLWFGDLKHFSAQLTGETNWREQLAERPSGEENASEATWNEWEEAYLLRYAKSIASNRESFRAFELDVSELEDKGVRISDSRIQLTRARLSCFGTGVGFLGLVVEYKEITAEEETEKAISLDKIADFTYRFKRTDQPMREGGPSLYEAVRATLPKAEDSVELFFYASSERKYDCLCYHILKLPQKPRDMERLKRQMFLLRWTYSTTFLNVTDETGDYDKEYSPYENDLWGWSQEGQVNICFENGRNDAFLRTKKYRQMICDLRLVFLLMLNQRFAAIRCIEEIAQATDRSNVKRIGARITELQTRYMFRVISNDLVCQNVYSYMYRIFEIDKLIDDLRDNERQIAERQSRREVEFSARTSRMLQFISVLSLLTATISIANYYERFLHSPEIAVLAAIGTTAAVACLWLTLLLKKE